MINFLGLFLLVVFILLCRRLAKRVKNLEKKLVDAGDEILSVRKRVSALECEVQTDRIPVFALQSSPEAATQGETVKAAPPPTTATKHEVPGRAGIYSIENPEQCPSHISNSQEESVSSAAPGQGSSPRTLKSLSPWHRIEKQIAENWTGIVGTMVLVLGIGFLGIYTALRMSEFYRFLMIVTCALIMASSFLVLRRKVKWLKLSLWMRSGSGAVFLFACLGAGGISGLHWIHRPLYGLIVLSLGIAANLYLAMVGGKQVFASLHVLLGLVALMIAPQTETTLIVASVVALFGIVLTYREKWDYHLLLSISSFFVYHTYWYFRSGGKAALSMEQNVTGIVVVSAVCALAACVHYRKVYGAKEFEKTPFMVHLLNWVYFGLGLLMHVNGMKWETIPIFLGAAIAFALAREARKLRIRWLHCTDMLIAQIGTIIGMTSLTKWDIGYDVILTIVFLEVLAFTRIVVIVKETFLYRAGIIYSQLSGLSVVVAFAFMGNLSDGVICLRQSALSALCVMGSLALHWSLARTKERQLLAYDSILSIGSAGKRELSITGMMAGIFLLCAAVFAHDTLWLHYAVVAAGVALLFLRLKLSTNGLAAGIALFALGLHGITWYGFYTCAKLGSGELLARGLPVFLISFAVVRWDNGPSSKAHFKWFGIYLGVVHFAILSHLLFKPISPLIPGICWLIASLPLLEVARWVSIRNKGDTSGIGQPDRYFLHIPLCQRPSCRPFDIQQEAIQVSRLSAEHQ